jgi:hypothetical protein
MKLNEKQLADIKRLGAAFRKIEDTCLIMQIDEAEFRSELKDKKSAAYKAYYGGREEMITKVMESVNDLATRGSSQAQQLSVEFYRDLKIDEV